MSVVLYEGVVATPRIVELEGCRSVRAAVELPIAFCQVSPKRANAFITCHGLRKQLWRHSNNPIDPPKFPRS